MPKSVMPQSSFDKGTTVAITHPTNLSMKRLVIIGLMALASFATLATVSGCSSKPKQSPRVAEQVEDSFRQRWIAQRMGQLQASGQATDARQARRMATDEFKLRYPNLSIAQNPDATLGTVE